MSAFYFAYGSNMNPVRMAARGMRYRHTVGAGLYGWRLCFNKRAGEPDGAAYANIVPWADARVEGVLYRLDHEREIQRMDPFEGRPERYERYLMDVKTADGMGRAWVYVATSAWQADGLLPERWYLNHLLAGRPWLSAAYFRALRRQACLSAV